MRVMDWIKDYYFIVVCENVGCDSKTLERTMGCFVNKENTLRANQQILNTVTFIHGKTPYDIFTKSMKSDIGINNKKLKE